MNKPVKIFSGLIIFILLAGIALAASVHFYLTDERIKSLIIPPAEEALGRTVAIGEIQVSLLSGITVRDFSIKEQDKSTDFIKAEAFVLQYELMPLLQKEVVISQVRLSGPTIQVKRDASGSFNFESLAIMAPKDSAAKKAPTPGQKAALPLALTVDQIRIDNARFTLEDAKKELPDITATSNVEVGLNLADLNKIDYQGTLQFQAKAKYGQLQPTASGILTFSPKQVSINADAVLDKETVHLEGLVTELAKGPAIKLDLSSQELDLDHLLAMIAGLPKAAEKTTKKSKKATDKPAAIGQSLPPHLTMFGAIKVTKTRYNQLDIDNFHLTYNLKGGIFQVTDLSAHTVGGQITGKEIAVDLNRPELSYRGQLNVSALQFVPLQQALMPDKPVVFGGSANSSLTFAGTGIQWEKIQQSLIAQGEYSLSTGWFKNNEITRTVAALIGLQEINNLTFDDANGEISVKDGQVLLRSQLSGAEMLVNAQGSIGLNGALNLPISIRFSPALSSKLQQRISIAKYLANEKGETILRLKIGGTIQKPRPALDQKMVEESAGRAIEKKLIETLGKELTGKEGEDDKPNPAKDLIKGIFGF